jgi:transposase InsO family protein
MVYYNNFRPHQALGGKTPKDFAADKKIRSTN